MRDEGSVYALSHYRTNPFRVLPQAGSLPGGQDGGPVRTLSSCASSRPEGIPRPSQEGRSSFDEDSIADILVKASIETR